MGGVAAVRIGAVATEGIGRAELPECPHDGRGGGLGRAGRQGEPGWQRDRAAATAASADDQRCSRRVAEAGDGGCRFRKLVSSPERGALSVPGDSEQRCVVKS